jgi:hypothetical protein
LERRRKAHRKQINAYSEEEEEDRMDMGDEPMSMSMVMTFGKWTDYQLQLIFSSWDIKTRSEYTVAWFAVVIAVICWHGLKYFSSSFVEESLRHIVLNTKAISRDDTEYSNINSPQSISDTAKSTTTHLLLISGKTSTTWRRVLILRFLHSILAAMTYGLALLLMLVSMTYNIGLFAALIIGYFLGDLIFYMASIHNPPATTLQQECH